MLLSKPELFPCRCGDIPSIIRGTSGDFAYVCRKPGVGSKYNCFYYESASVHVVATALYNDDNKDAAVKEWNSKYGSNPRRDQ
jgi:hypothetical protein